MSQARIQIFWDLESCPPPPLYSGSCWDLLKSVRSFTNRFGAVTSIKAYWDHSKAQNSQKSYDGQLRAAMPSMGVNLVDCTLMEEYSEESLARTLIVDFMLSAVDSAVDVSERNIIMIFSGNKAILHPISLLLFRGYTIILVIPSGDQEIEASRATRVFHWQADVLGLRHDQESRSVSRPGIENSRSSGGLSANGTPEVPPSADLDTSEPMSPQPHRNATLLHPTVSKPLTTAIASTIPRVEFKSMSTFETPGSHAPSVLGLHSEATSSGINHTTSQSGSELLLAQLLSETAPVPGKGKGADNNGSTGSAWGSAGPSWLPRPAVPELGQLIREGYQYQPQPQEPDIAQPKVGPQLGSPNIGNSAFKPLLQLLRKAKAEGKSQVLRSQVGEVLSKDKNTYLAAGVTSFSGYVTFAEQRGLIELGRTGSQDWIALKTKAKKTL